MRGVTLLLSYALWRLWRRDRKRLGALSDADDDASEIALGEAVLARAESSMRIELGVADTVDLKAVGLATADVAALTISVLFHKDLPAWWISVTIMALAGVCFFFVLRQREWFYEPNLDLFWAEHVGQPPAQIPEAMLAAIVEARGKNRHHIENKATWFRWGYWCLSAGLLALLASAVKRAVG